MSEISQEFCFRIEIPVGDLVMMPRRLSSVKLNGEAQAEGRATCISKMFKTMRLDEIPLAEEKSAAWGWQAGLGKGRVCDTTVFRGQAEEEKPTKETKKKQPVK